MEIEKKKQIVDRPKGFISISDSYASNLFLAYECKIVVEGVSRQKFGEVVLEDVESESVLVSKQQLLSNLMIRNFSFINILNEFVMDIV